jgi:hypothetical protein
MGIIRRKGIQTRIRGSLYNLYLKITNPGKLIKYTEFKQFLENKRVCLVGPAEYVEKEFENHGKMIDSYDLVIRLNNFINLDESLHKNFGKRTDILITSLNYNLWNTYCHEEAYSYEKINKPLLIYFQNERLGKLFISFFNKNTNITICEQPKKNINELTELIKIPTTGILAIFECLKCNPKELFITGLTFGRDEKYSTYIDKYYKYITQNKEKKDKKGFAADHNLTEEFNLAKKLLLNHDNIFIDKYLNHEIFHLKDETKIKK